MSGAPTLYDDQKDLVNRVRESFRTYQDVMMLSPTGSGKSRMAMNIVHSALSKGRNVIIDVPLRDLRRQLSNSALDFNIRHSFVAGGCKYDAFSNFWISTSPAMAIKLGKSPPNCNLLIVDEAHQAGAARESVIEYYKSKGAKILRMSASPERPDGKPIGCEHLVEGKSVRELMDMGRLSDYRLFNASKPDLSKLRMSSSGDFRESDVSGFMESQSVLIGDCVTHYKRLCEGRRLLVFCASIKHSQMVAQAFNDAGIPAAHIDGKMNDAERDIIVQAYASRAIKVITNSDLCTYGWDLAQASGVKDAVVECIADLKPTMSRPLQWQKNGRGFRVKPDGSDCIILDHASNAFNPDGSVKFGLPCGDVNWEWQGREKRSGSGGEKAVPCRVCVSCFRAHSPSPACPYCGHKYEVIGRTVEEIEGELVEISREEAKQIAKQERMNQGRAQTFEDLLELEQRKGAKIGWADFVFMGRNKSVNRMQLRARRQAWKQKQKALSPA